MERLSASVPRPPALQMPFDDGDTRAELFGISGGQCNDAFWSCEQDDDIKMICQAALLVYWTRKLWVRFIH